jgi:hypothetical protein
MSTLGRDTLQKPIDVDEVGGSRFFGSLDVEDANQESGESRYACRIGAGGFSFHWTVRLRSFRGKHAVVSPLLRSGAWVSQIIVEI